MHKKNLILVLLLPLMLLSSCISGIWTGANLIYGRHNLYKKISDYKLNTATNFALFNTKGLKCAACVIDVTVFNADILISGHVPTQKIAQILQKRLQQISNYRHLYNKVIVANIIPQELQDSWITMQIRSQILQDANIDPDVFKIVTTDGIVYIMGRAHLEQTKAVIDLAKNATNVRKVVVLVHSLVEKHAHRF